MLNVGWLDPMMAVNNPSMGPYLLGGGGIGGVTLRFP